MSSSSAPNVSFAAKPTALAQKYGVYENSKTLRGQGKSALTPLEYRNRFRNALDELKYRSRESIQRSHLQGFTSAELHTIGALYDPGARPNNLDTPVHPLYARTNWEGNFRGSTAAPKLEHRLTGRWSVRENDLLWDALLPALRIASMLLSCTHIWPWFDALLFGERKDITALLRPIEKPAKWEKAMTQRSFWRRDPRIATKQQSKYKHSTLDWLARHTTLGIDWSEDQKARAWFRQTDKNRLKFRFREEATICLSSHLVEPLLRSDLTEAERLAQNLQVAFTLLHETTHAISWQVDKKYDFHKAPWYEPFFEDENLSEIGISFENNVVGGRQLNLWDDRRKDLKVPDDWTPPGMATLIDQAPYARTARTYSNAFQTNDYPQHEKFNLRLPISDKMYDTSTHWPMPVQTASNMQQVDWWQALVLPGGRTAFRIPRIIGMEIDNRNKHRTQFEPVRGPDYDAWAAAGEPPPLNSVSGGGITNPFLPSSLDALTSLATRVGIRDSLREQTNSAVMELRADRARLKKARAYYAMYHTDWVETDPGPEPQPPAAPRPWEEISATLPGRMMRSDIQALEQASKQARERWEYDMAGYWEQWKEWQKQDILYKDTVKFKELEDSVYKRYTPPNVAMQRLEQIVDQEQAAARAAAAAAAAASTVPTSSLEKAVKHVLLSDSEDELPPAMAEMELNARDNFRALGAGFKRRSGASDGSKKRMRDKNSDDVGGDDDEWKDWKVMGKRRKSRNDVAKGPGGFCSSWL